MAARVARRFREETTPLNHCKNPATAALLARAAPAAQAATAAMTSGIRIMGPATPDVQRNTIDVVWGGDGGLGGQGGNGGYGGAGAEAYGIEVLNTGASPELVDNQVNDVQGGNGGPGGLGGEGGIGTNGGNGVVVESEDSCRRRRQRGRWAGWWRRWRRRPWRPGHGPLCRVRSHLLPRSAQHPGQCPRWSRWTGWQRRPCRRRRHRWQWRH